MAVSKIENYQLIPKQYSVDVACIGYKNIYKFGRFGIIQIDDTVAFNITAGRKIISLPNDMESLLACRFVAVDSNGSTYGIQISGKDVYSTQAISANTVVGFLAVYLTSN